MFFFSISSTTVNIQVCILFILWLMDTRQQKFVTAQKQTKADDTEEKKKRLKPDIINLQACSYHFELNSFKLLLLRFQQTERY